MTKKIKPNVYDDDGYSHACKACMARDIVDGSVVELDRTLRHIFRDMEALIKSSDSPVAIKVRKHAGMDLRREKISQSMNGLLGAFYDVWVDLEERMDHEKDTVKEFRTARKKGGVNTQANHPTRQFKDKMHEEWKRWQLNRTLYKYPRDYRKAMLTKFPDSVDGTLKNWMVQWAREA